MLNIFEFTKTFKNLIDVRFQIIKEEIKDEINTIITRIVILISMALTGLFILTFGSIALGFYFSELTGNSSLGFLYVALVYLFILIILFLIRNSPALQSNLKNSLTKFIFLFKRKTP